VAWTDNALFDFIKQSYLLKARWLQNAVRDVEGIDAHTARKLDFYTRQFVDAIAPSNFLMTNPEVLRTTIESRGKNLLNGLKNLLNDLERGEGRLAIKMTDTEAFQIGENIAVTPGKVVYQNDLSQLIQYEPTTENVKRRPLLIIPPWINKFYILDLQPSNSFIRWAVSQGHTVFLISWVNPDEKLAAKTFTDYMLEGPLAALDAIEQATGEREANVIGYCLGGTLLASTLAYTAAKRDNRIKSATYFATMVDFAEAGELSVFIDEQQVSTLEERMNAKGYLEGRDMATAFNMLRANDSIWSFVINNYLLGKSPFPFDLLYWNHDSTRMPAAMHSFYLRNMYQENLLSKPGGSASTACRSTYAKSVRRPFYCRLARTTSLLGGRLTLRPSFIAVLSNSCCPALVTLQASSIHRAANMAIGRTGRTRRPRRGGSPPRRPNPIPGGRHGRAGSRNALEATCQRGTRATANSNRSKTPPALTSRCAPPIDRIQRARRWRMGRISASVTQY
jgi:class I poly(R)-hydroxyalkanoic acid synthase